MEEYKKVILIGVVFVALANANGANNGD